MNKHDQDQEYAKLCSQFISQNKTLLLAPAGYGKTYTISEILSKYSNGKYLVLTHTHAGIASIKEKLANKSVSPKRFNVETISGYAQKYAVAYTDPDDIPSQEERDDYYPFIHNRLHDLLDLPFIQQVIKATYSGVIVDEYQDCNLKQHEIILKMADIIPVHVLGDGMQGIFDFDQDLIKWSQVETDFTSVGQLETQWRWENEGNSALGKEIASIREILENKNQVDISAYDQIDYRQISSDNQTGLYKAISEVLNEEENVLLLEADSANRAKRIKLISKFPGRLHMIESIDEKSFYEYAKLIDIMPTNFYANLLILIKGEKSKTKNRSKGGLMTGLSSLLKDGDKPRKSKNNVEELTVYNTVESLTNDFSLQTLKELLDQLKRLGKVPSRDLYYSLIKAIELAITNESSVYDGMVEVRNNLRRVGRKMYGKVIGTTLLTKGLEMECVVIIDAHKIPDHKNFYVAISRASKRLVILSETSNLDFFIEQEDNEVSTVMDSVKQLSFDFQ